MTDQTRTPKEELISASNCLYLEVHESIAKDVRKKIDAVLEELVQAQATIAAMREAVLQTTRDLFDDLTPEAILRLDAAVGINAATGQDDYAQLAADHDARIQAEERRRVLEEVGGKLDDLLNEMDVPPPISDSG